PLDPVVGPVLGAGAEFIGNYRGTGFQSLELSRCAFAVIRMHQIEIRPGQELFRRVTEDFFPRWISPLQATVEARHAEQVAGKGEKPIELRLDAPALNHNANLIRHGRNESNEPLVFRLRFASKKFY